MKIELENYIDNQVRWPIENVDYDELTDEIAIHKFLSSLQYKSHYFPTDTAWDSRLRRNTHIISDYGKGLIQEESKDFDNWVGMLERLPVQVVMKRYEITKYNKEST